MEKFSLILALMKRRKNIFSLRTVASYQFLALWSSFYIAWHFSAPCGGCSWFTGAAVLLVSYAFFNTFWLMVASLRRKITLSRSIFNLSSLALGFIFFLMLLFIVSDFLLNIPAYANLYFAHPDTAAWGLAALAALISLYGFSMRAASALPLTKSVQKKPASTLPWRWFPTCISTIAALA